MTFTIGNVEVEILGPRAGIVSVFNKKAKRGVDTWWAFHLGVYPHMDAYYKTKGKGEVVVEGYWVWGFATEMYDHCGEYFGLGPLLLVCY